MKLITSIVLLLLISMSCTSDKKPVYIENKNISTELVLRESPSEIKSKSTDTRSDSTNIIPTSSPSESIISEELDYHYHVISASFLKLSDAVLYKNSLKEQGYPSRVVSSGRRHRVSIRSFSDKKTAEQELNKLKTLSSNPDLWVLHK